MRGLQLNARASAERLNYFHERLSHPFTFKHAKYGVWG